MLKTLAAEVLVIGGGATGAGVARDLAMRGLRTVLVEKGDLSTGTTGRYHGLLHSGGRYVVKDPQAALECIQENRILRKIMPFCLEDTGGYFVVTPWDDLVYAEEFVRASQQTGIPVEEVDVSRMLREEPLLNPKIVRCLRVPDAAADSFLATKANVLSASQHGAKVFTYHAVKELTLSGNRVTGALVENVVNGELLTIAADLVVNAAGAWAGILTQNTGIRINILPGKGVMVALNRRIVNKVINRCKLPADGDILVPIHTVSIIGTTDSPVPNPDRVNVESWEVQLLLEEGEKMIPGFREMRFLRAWAGVRPLFQAENKETTDSREVSRAYVLLDHEARDGIAGLVTITSGKWTTYRRMAEATTDLVCRKLKIQRACRTHLETLPNPHAPGEKLTYHLTGARLAKTEKHQEFASLVCECELVSREMIIDALKRGEVVSLDDLRRETRLGMGPCQGGFCTLRASGIMFELGSPLEKANHALRHFLQERWRGVRPILWGKQLQQERFNELIFKSVLNVEMLSNSTDLPVQTTSDNNLPTGKITHFSEANPIKNAPVQDVVIIGAGIAGLTTAWRTLRRGMKTKVVAKGYGSLYWQPGCIDVFGYSPLDHALVHSPLEAIQELAARSPDHPYTRVGIPNLEMAVNDFIELTESAGYPFKGSLTQNWLLPTSVGAFRPTCLAPATMLGGDLKTRSPILLVGIHGLHDFSSALIAGNLATQGIETSCLTLDITAIGFNQLVNARNLAAFFDQPENLEKFVDLLKHSISKNSHSTSVRLGFPAVLGLKRAYQNVISMESQLGALVFEIPTLPPSIPGIRLANLLLDHLVKLGGEVNLGMQVIGFETTHERINSLTSEAASRRLAHPASHFVLASGGYLSGGLNLPYQGCPSETIFNLEFSGLHPGDPLFSGTFLDTAGHPLFRNGIETNQAFQPVSQEEANPYQNLWVVGSGLGGGDWIHERSLDGIGLFTGHFVGDRLG